jgi:hypothetical protein
MQEIGPDQDQALGFNQTTCLQLYPLHPLHPCKKKVLKVEPNQRPIGYRFKAFWDAFRFNRFSQILTAAKIRFVVVGLKESSENLIPFLSHQALKEQGRFLECKKII